LFQNTPQSGAGVVPENLAIFNGFFTSALYDTTAGTNFGKPKGNTFSTPVSANGDPADGYVTQQVADTANGQLDLVTLTPGINEPYGVHNVQFTSVQTPFNGTSPNANGQYCIVLWTPSTQNYQVKSSGQLFLNIPGSSSSSTPGFIDSSGSSPIITNPGVLIPVPEPSTYVLVAIATGVLAVAARRKGKFASSPIGSNG
jgi:hypothetical protein